MLLRGNQSRDIIYFILFSIGILLDEVNCRGSEDNLLVCAHRVLGEHDCKHAQDAGVRCSSPTVQHSMKLPKPSKKTKKQIIHRAAPQ